VSRAGNCVQDAVRNNETIWTNEVQVGAFCSDQTIPFSIRAMMRTVVSPYRSP